LFESPAMKCNLRLFSSFVSKSGKGDKDRFITLPVTLTPLLQNHLAGVKTLHQQDLTQGHGEAYLPHALARKAPHAAQVWGWQYVFPARTLPIVQLACCRLCRASHWDSVGTA
jgi:hypothetical protein